MKQGQCHHLAFVLDFFPAGLFFLERNMAIVYLYKQWDGIQESAKPPRQGTGPQGAFHQGSFLLGFPAPQLPDSTVDVRDSRGQAQALGAVNIQRLPFLRDAPMHQLKPLDFQRGDS